MAIESVIELRINGIEQLDELERRLEGLRDGSINLAGGGGGGASTTNVTINEYNTHTQAQQRNEIHAFSRGLHMATSTVGNLTSSFVKLSKSILGTGGLLSGVTSMATIAGMLKTAQNINQAAFMTNASGMNPNDLNRLKATYGQIFNVESVTSALAREKAAPYSMLMTQMGLTQQQAQGMSTEQLMKRVSEHARGMAQRYGANELALQAGGLQGVMSVDDLLRELNIKPGQQATIGGLAEKYRGITQLERPEEWQRFSSMMSLGTQAVGTKMENLLRPLLDPLFNVFDSFFDRIFGDQNQRMWEDAIESIRKGLVSISEFIKTGDWNQLWEKIKEFIEKPLAKFADYIENNFSPTLIKLENAFNTLNTGINMIANAFKGVYDFMIEKGIIKPQAEATEMLEKSQQQFDAAFAGAEAPIIKQAFRRSAEQEVMRRGLPPEMADFLEAQAVQETRGFKSVNSWNFGNITGEYKGKYRVRGDTDAQGRPIRQKFRAYENPDEAVIDMLDLLQRKYPKAYSAHSIEEYSEGLKGWAADPSYAPHVKQHFKGRSAPMTGNVSRPMYGNTKVDVNIQNQTSADVNAQVSKLPNSPNTSGR